MGLRNNHSEIFFPGMDQGATLTENRTELLVWEPPEKTDAIPRQLPEFSGVYAVTNNPERKAHSVERTNGQVQPLVGGQLASGQEIFLGGWCDLEIANSYRRIEDRRLPTIVFVNSPGHIPGVRNEIINSGRSTVVPDPKVAGYEGKKFPFPNTLGQIQIRVISAPSITYRSMAVTNVTSLGLCQHPFAHTSIRTDYQVICGKVELLYR
jgi:hypothetical protein